MGLSSKDLKMVSVLLAGAVLVVLNQTLLSPALPSIMADQNVSATTVQWLTSGYSLVEAVVIPLSAFFIGQFSTRKLFISGITLFAIGSVVAAISPSFPFLLLGRILQACSTGVVMPMVISVILLIFPREKRGTAMGIVSLVISFAPAIGPSLSGVLVDSVGWRYIFVIVAALSALLVISSVFLVYNREGFEKNPFDIPSVILSSLGLLSLLYGFSSFSSSDNLLIPVALMIVGIALIGLFARRQLNLEVPLLRVEILKSRRYRTAAIIVCLLQMAMVGSGVILPIYIQNVLGMSATISGISMLPGAIVGAAAGLLAGRVFDKHGVRGITICGGFLLAAGGISMHFMGDSSWIVIVAAGYSVVVIGIQLLMTPLNTWGLNSLDNSVIQHANALSNTLNQVGGSLGTALMVSLSAMAGIFYPQAAAEQSQFLGLHISFTAMGILLTVIFLLILALVRNKKTDISRKQARQMAIAHGVKPAVIAAAHAGQEVDLFDNNWTVRDVMNPNSPSINYHADIRDAVGLLATNGSSGFPVVDDKNKVIGFLSSGDIMKYLGKEDERVSDGFSLYHVFDNRSMQQRLDEMMQLSVTAIATMKPVCLDADMDITDACAKLSNKQIKKMPVIDEEGKYLGCLSRTNVIAAVSYYLNGTKPVMAEGAIINQMI